MDTRLTEIQRIDGKYSLYRCACGREKAADRGSVRSGSTRSCGCLRREVSAARAITRSTHGMSYSREYKAWRQMIERCHDSRAYAYSEYGKRGIFVCERWRSSFSAFLADVGFRPGRGYSLDRIENDLGYYPGNCRWADATTQNNNRRNNRFLTANGVRDTIAGWTRRTGLAKHVIRHRVADLGWSDDAAVNTPVAYRKPRGVR